jgi:hypothetical protein
VEESGEDGWEGIGTGDPLGGAYYACWMGCFDSIRNGVI